jgi:hypothetical protein
LTGGLLTVMTATSPSMASVTIFELMAISSRRRFWCYGSL